MAHYELWDFESGNLVGAYTTERAALEAVLESVELYGPSSIESLALGRDADDGSSKLIAKGSALIARAQLPMAAPAATTKARHSTEGQVDGGRSLAADRSQKARNTTRNDTKVRGHQFE